MLRETPPEPRHDRTRSCRCARHHRAHRARAARRGGRPGADRSDDAGGRCDRRRHARGAGDRLAAPLGMTLAFLLAVAAVAVLSGATASVVGFGIGSLLTPLLATRIGMPAAVAAVALPHAAATALRCWRLRHAIDREVLRGFGALSAVGGFAGALLYTRLGGRGLTVALGALLLLTAAAGLTGLADRWRPR